MLWVDKYRPHAFADFTLNQNHASSMEKLLAKGAWQAVERSAVSERCSNSACLQETFPISCCMGQLAQARRPL